MVPGVGSAAKMKAPMKKDGEIESARQEKKDLMKDNPVDKDASGKRLRGGGKRPKRKPTLKEIQNRKSPKGRIYG